MKTKYTKSDAIMAAIKFASLCFSPLIATALIIAAGRCFDLPNAVMAVLFVGFLFFLVVLCFYKIALSDMGIKGEGSK